MYLWEQDAWPNLSYDTAAIEAILVKAAGKAGRLSGIRQGLDPIDQNEGLLEELTAEAVTSFGIEGVSINPESMRQSIVASLMERDRVKVVQGRPAGGAEEGIARMMVDALDTQTPMSVERLSNWHRLIHPKRIHPNQVIGDIRDGPISVVTEKKMVVTDVHLVAPPAGRVRAQLTQLVDWMEAARQAPSGQAIPSAPVRAALAHLRFETIHPFDDGNGRIGRAMADNVLRHSSTFAAAPFSISRAILDDKTGYYDALERAQKVTPNGEGKLDVTGFVSWFSETLSSGLDFALDRARLLVARNRFFALNGGALMDRQTRALRSLFDGAPSQVGREFSAKWYQQIAEVGKSTATRDLADLVGKGVILSTGKQGRGALYMLNLETVQDNHWRARDPASRVIENVTRPGKVRDYASSILTSWSRALDSVDNLIAFRAHIGRLLEGRHDLFDPGLGDAYFAKLGTDRALRVELGQAMAAQAFSDQLQNAGPAGRNGFIKEALELESINPYARLTNDALSRSSPAIGTALAAQREAGAQSGQLLTGKSIIGVTEHAQFKTLPDAVLSAIAVQDAKVQKDISFVERAIGRLYKDPQSAAAEMIKAAQDPDVRPKAIGDDLIASPSRFGQLREQGNLGEKREANATKKKVRELAGTIRSVKSQLVSIDGELVKVVNQGVSAPSKGLQAGMDRVINGNTLPASGDNYRPGLAKEAKKIQSGLSQSLRSLSMKIGDKTLLAGAPIKANEKLAHLSKGSPALKVIAGLASPVAGLTPNVTN